RVVADEERRVARATSGTARLDDQGPQPCRDLLVELDLVLVAVETVAGGPLADGLVAIGGKVRAVRGRRHPGRAGAGAHQRIEEPLVGVAADRPPGPRRGALVAHPDAGVAQ